VDAFLEQKGNALRARVERGQDERRVALRVAGVHVRAVVEQLADGWRVRISDRRDQIGPHRLGPTRLAGASRSRGSRAEPGPTREQKGRESNAREQNHRDSDARETVVTFRTTHEATPLQDEDMTGCPAAFGAATFCHLGLPDGPLQLSAKEVRRWSENP